MNFTKDDFAYLSQVQGKVCPVDWIVIQDVEYQNTGKFVRLAYLKGDEPSNMFVNPPGWKFERSLSAENLSTPANDNRIGTLKKDPDGLLTTYDKLPDQVVHPAELN